MRVGAVLCSLIVVTLAACERRSRVDLPECDVNETGINDSTIGPLAIGEPVPALRQRCPAVADTTLTMPMVGWTDSVRAIRLVVRGVPVVATYEKQQTTAGPGSEAVTALRVESPFFRTNDSLGVGTSVARFRNQRGVRVTQMGDSPRVLLLDRRRCGVSYELSRWGGAPPLTSEDPPVTGMQLTSWPDDITITAVNVTGCRGNVRDLGVDSITEASTDTRVSTVDSLTVSQLPSGTRMPPPSASPLSVGNSSTAVAPTPATPMTGTSPRPTRADSGVNANASELQQLAAVLDVPVQGVERTQLRDTYAEPRSGHTHEALDIIAPRGTPVMSATDGTLRKLHNSKAGGLMVYSGDASDRFLLLYGHLDRYADGVKEGMPLKRGQVIGYVGTTGNAPIGTPHLHFAIMRGKPSQAWWRGTPVNPYPLLAGRR